MECDDGNHKWVLSKLGVIVSDLAKKALHHVVAKVEIAEALFSSAKMLKNHSSIATKYFVQLKKALIESIGN